ncbi:MAG: 16S rRNA (guanine(527)-N(7))-methyltransferase RsmG [Desulfuromonadales bacterium]|nr:16S rRNA (guanine(527)-N(7))-methyltransferase RsmG [Desulfuromonadales bacterium]
MNYQLALLGVQLDLAIIESEVDFLLELLRWNKTYNLTAITDPEEGIERHLVDSLTLFPYLDGAASLLDIGSGGGFPGIPLQIASPALRVVSVDAVAKKIDFQRHIVRRFKLSNFTPWHGRIEQLLKLPCAVEGFDLVVARAFSSLYALLELALPYVKPGGRIVAMKGPEGGRELVEVGKWLTENDLYCSQQIFLTLPGSGACRSLLFFARKPQKADL